MAACSPRGDAVELRLAGSGPCTEEGLFRRFLAFDLTLYEFNAVLWAEGNVEPAVAAGIGECSDVHVEVAAVEGRVLVAGPGVVHDDGFERADFDANVAAHAARVIDPELLDDLAAVAGPFRVLRVVLHGGSHAIDGAVANTDVAARAEGLVVVEVPGEHRGSCAAAQAAGAFVRVFDGHRLARDRGERVVEEAFQGTPFMNRHLQLRPVRADQRLSGRPAERLAHDDGDEHCRAERTREREQPLRPVVDEDEAVHRESGGWSSAGAPSSRNS